MLPHDRRLARAAGPGLHETSATAAPAPGTLDSARLGGDRIAQSLTCVLVR